MNSEENSLITRIQNGETDLFGEIYEAYARKLYAFIYYKTHHKQTSEDLLSQTFIKALEKIALFDEEKGSFNAWIYSIARNCVYDYFRSLKLNKNIEDAWDLASGDDVARDAQNRIQLEEIREGLSKLSPIQREIITLRVWEGMSYEEIGSIVNKSGDACKMDFSRGIKKLKKEVVLLLLLATLSF